MILVLAILTLLGWLYTLPKPVFGEKIPKPGENHLEVDEHGLHEVLSDEERKRIYH